MSAKLSKCFRCGSTDIQDKLVEELVRQGPYVVALRLPANTVRAAAGGTSIETT